MTTRRGAGTSCSRGADVGWEADGLDLPAHEPEMRLGIRKRRARGRSAHPPVRVVVRISCKVELLSERQFALTPYSLGAT